MICLLDVNVLLALGYARHVHHERVMSWLRSLQLQDPRPRRMATCAITELGFVRIATGPAGFAPTISVACADLSRLNKREKFTFLADVTSAEHLPSWVARSEQTTDGHLLQLAEYSEAVLATLDTKIPGALLIPALPANSEGISEPTPEYRAAA